MLMVKKKRKEKKPWKLQNSQGQKESLLIVLLWDNVKDLVRIFPLFFILQSEWQIERDWAQENFVASSIHFVLLYQYIRDWVIYKEQSFCRHGGMYL
jgi:hypothetical protein